MNDYDKAGRYLVKRDPEGQFSWLLVSSELSFHTWIDARRVVLPNQHDLTNDLVAAIRRGEVLEAICLELEAEARADALLRLHRYLAVLWSEPAGQDSLPLSCVNGVILDLTGRSAARALSLRSVIIPACHLEFTVLRRHLVDENAAQVVAGVAAGTISPWVLGWVPLMRRGEESGIIGQWREAAQRLLPDKRDRADLGTVALTFATLAGCRAAWDQGLRGWSMLTSPLWDEIRATGRIEGVRMTVLRQGRQKFHRAPSRKQQKALEAVTDLAQLEALADRLLTVDSWAKLLNGLAQP
jgi:hypothetical protein